MINIQKHEFTSINLDEKREFWVCLPINFENTKSYPIIYVLDAEWRFNKVNRVVKNMEKYNKIPAHILVGIPHLDSCDKRGKDMTFSQSRNDYDGTISSEFNKTNSGGGENFYKFLSEELMEWIEKNYLTNGDNILIGHSFGGYFGSYILLRENKFNYYQLYDPSIWYATGEVIQAIKKDRIQSKNQNTKVFISYQIGSEFHTLKIKELIAICSEYEDLKLDYKEYREETHYSMYMRSIHDGFKVLYSNWKKK